MLEVTVICAIIAGIVTVVSLAIRYAFLSKCTSTSCFWGCLKFNRDTTHEQANVSDRNLAT